MALKKYLYRILGLSELSTMLDLIPLEEFGLPDQAA